jgi:hypothetical protein
MLTSTRRKRAHIRAARGSSREALTAIFVAGTSQQKMRPFEVRGRPIGRCEAAKGGRWCQACEYGLLLVFSPLLRARLAENKSASSPFLALACSVSTFQGIWPAKRLGGSTIEAIASAV